MHPLLTSFLLPLLLPQTHAFIVGPTIKSAVTTAKCLDTTGTLTLPGTKTPLAITFNHVGKYPCVLNNAASKAAARAAPGDDPSPDFTVGKDIETQVGEKNCLKVTGRIEIPGVGSAAVTFRHVDKYACMFSVVGEIEGGGKVNATSSEGGEGGDGGSATSSAKAAGGTGGSGGGGGEVDDSCS